MSDSAYIVVKDEIKHLEAEIARLTRRLTAACAFVASYENGEDTVTDYRSNGAVPDVETGITPAAPMPNDNLIIRFPQVASGRRLRPGAFKYDVIRGAFDLLVSQTPFRKLHKREIINYLTEKGVLEGLADPMGRVSVILSQSKGILTSDGGGNWFIDPALLPESSQHKEAGSE